jgi:hypothetical protein
LLEVFEGVLVEVGLGMAEDEEEVVCEVDEFVAEPTSTGATVTLLFGSLQQFVVSPQHHVVELAVASQGVTRTSVFGPSPYTSQSASCNIRHSHITYVS